MNITRGTALRSRRGRGQMVYEVALSPDLTVGVRYRNLASLIMLGDLPNPLRALVAEIDQSGAVPLADDSGARMKTFLELVDNLGKAMIVQPGWCTVEELGDRDTPDDERLCLFDLDPGEMTALVTIAFKGLSAYESFRAERTRAVVGVAEQPAAPAAAPTGPPAAAAAPGGVSRPGRTPTVVPVEFAPGRDANRSPDFYDLDVWRDAIVPLARA